MRVEQHHAKGAADGGRGEEKAVCRVEGIEGDRGRGLRRHDVRAGKAVLCERFERFGGLKSSNLRYFSAGLGRLRGCRAGRCFGESPPIKARTEATLRAATHVTRTAGAL